MHSLRDIVFGIHAVAGVYYVYNLDIIMAALLRSCVRAFVVPAAPIMSAIAKSAEIDERNALLRMCGFS